MSKTRGQRTWEQRLDTWAQGEPVPEAKIRGWRQVQALADGYQNGYRSTMVKMGQEAAEALVAQREAMGPLPITDEQTVKGLDYTRRNARRLERLHGFPATEIVEHFQRYTWEGLHYTGGNQYRQYEPCDYLPVYGVELNDGRKLTYHVSPWQAGADLEWEWVNG